MDTCRTIVLSSNSSDIIDSSSSIGDEVRVSNTVAGYLWIDDENSLYSRMRIQTFVVGVCRCAVFYPLLFS